MQSNSCQMVIPLADAHSFISGPDILVILIILAIFAVPGGIVLLILRIAKGRQKNPPPLPMSTESKEAAKPYEGIAGWLILVALILVRAPIAVSITLFRSVFPLLRHDTWMALTTKNSEAYHPLWAPVIVSELIVNIVFLVLAIVVLVLFFRRKQSFPKFVICLYLANLVWEISLGFVYRKIPAMAEESSTWFDADTIGLALGCAIWIPYFIFSKRVRATFTR